jgi:serine protease Do
VNLFLPSLRGALCVLLTNLLVLGLAGAAAADTPAALQEAPETLEDLRALQKQVRAVVEKVSPATVAVRVGPAVGSGVIVSADGYVLTAGHVSGEPGREAIVQLSDGRQVQGKTLGINLGADSGMIKIEDEGKWPFVEMGKSAALKKGQWCIATGHPGGPRRGRGPVVRLGRVLTVGKRFLRTDCTLISGDSGGPLFDLDGKVIGIHSHIGGPLTVNMHVVVDTYRDTWDRLAKGESWGGGPRPGGPYLGVRLDSEAPECIIRAVEADSPAAKAGLQPGDVVLRFNRDKVVDADDLVARTARRKPGDEVTLEVRRDQEVLQLKIVVGKRDS